MESYARAACGMLARPLVSRCWKREAYFLRDFLPSVFPVYVSPSRTIESGNLRSEKTRKSDTIQLVLVRAGYSLAAASLHCKLRGGS